jgi:hypothetical protein
MESTLRPANNFNIVTFNLLNFQPHPMGMGKQCIVQFPNGYGASIVQGPYTYGGDKGLYELAVFGKDGNITYDTPITSDVEGNLTESDVESLLTQIKGL